MAVRTALIFLCVGLAGACAPGDDACLALKAEQDESLELRQLRANQGEAAEASLSLQREAIEQELARVSQQESKLYYETTEDDETGFHCGGLTCAGGSHCCHGSTTICCGPGGHCSHGVGGMSLCTLR